MAFQTVNLAAIADAIREKDGTTDPILPIDFPDRIRAIPTGTDTSDATATADDILFPKTAYVDGQKVVGSIIPTQQPTPDINVDPTGLVTSEVIQPYSGYVAAGTRTAAMQLPTVGWKTVTPKSSQQVAVERGVYTTGEVLVAGDSNLAPDNIKSGVSIFGVVGSYSGGSSGGTTTPTPTPSETSETIGDLISKKGIKISSAYNLSTDTVSEKKWTLPSSIDANKVVAVTWSSPITKTSGFNNGNIMIVGFTYLFPFIMSETSVFGIVSHAYYDNFTTPGAARAYHTIFLGDSAIYGNAVSSELPYLTKSGNTLDIKSQSSVFSTGGKVYVLYTN